MSSKIFTAWLIDIVEAQNNIRRCNLGQKIHFVLNEEKRLEVYGYNNRYFGILAKKDSEGFEEIYKYPECFEGEIVGIAPSSKTNYKVKISISVKEEYRTKLFSLDNSTLNKLFVLEECFNAGDTIICNYGKAKVVKAFSYYLQVEVPHLGKRNIYDLSQIEIYKD